MRVFCCLILGLALAGCAPQLLQSTPTQSYRVGQSINAAPGGVFLSSQHGTINSVRRWVGIANSPDGWKSSTEYSPDFVRKELLYSGVSGSTIEIGYREFRGGMAAPAFYQSAKYDLSASKDISFQNFKFRVNSADNNGMTGVLLSDGMTTATANPTAAERQIPLMKGPSALVAEQAARGANCASSPNATLAGSGPGFENYTVPCANGDMLSIRCEFGSCRILR